MISQLLGEDVLRIVSVNYSKPDNVLLNSEEGFQTIHGMFFVKTLAEGRAGYCQVYSNTRLNYLHAKL